MKKNKQQGNPTSLKTKFMNEKFKNVRNLFHFEHIGQLGYLKSIGLLLLLTAVLMVLFQPLMTEKKETVARQEETVTYSDKHYHLEDNVALYKTSDYKDIETMFLTVGNGNQSDNTNHTWSEVNQLSVYDYEKMGVPRYKVAALLQVGNKNGPQSGKLGYGENVPNATVQIRGQTSSTNPQKNYKIEIKDNKGSWYGQKTINLNKHQGDSLRFRNMMAYTLLQDIPQLLSLRTQFVHLYVKDTNGKNPNQFVDYGLYTQVEQLNSAGMKAHNLDHSGQLYKVNYFEFIDPENVIRLTSDPEYDQAKFEKLLEIKGSTDHAKLISLMKKVNDPATDFEKVLKNELDSTNLAYWMAFQILVGNHDTQNRNMYLYSPLNSKRWYIIAWDNDNMLFSEEYAAEGKSGDASWETGISNYWGNMLFRRALQTESFQKELTAAVEDLRKQYLSNQKITDLSMNLAKVVEPYVSEVPDSTYLGLSTNDYQKVLKALPNEVEENYERYYSSYKKPMPFFIAVPEVSGKKLKLSWETAYDLHGENITYTVEVASDYNFSKPLYKADKLKLTSAEINVPTKGQYFIRVKATNASGESQYAFDYYVNSNDDKVSGVKSFFVNANGTVSEDVYVEE